MATKSLSETMLAKKQAAAAPAPEPTEAELQELVAKEVEEKAAQTKEAQDTAGGASTGPVGSMPSGNVQEKLGGKAEGEIEPPLEGGEPLPPLEETTVGEQKASEATQVAKDAGATEIPTLDDSSKTSGVAILKQTDTPTESEVQARRTEVNTNVIIQPSDPTGANPADPNPPNGTLPNSGMVYTQSTDTPMGSLEDALQKGVALGKVSEEENEKAVKLMEGQLRAQRMLEGRPHDADLALQQEEEGAPEGAEYKSNGIVRYVDHAGNWQNAVNGFFIPRDDEDRKILDHFVKQGVVSKV